MPKALCCAGNLRGLGAEKDTGAGLLQCQILRLSWTGCRVQMDRRANTLIEKHATLMLDHTK